VARKQSHPNLRERLTLVSLVRARGLSGTETVRVFFFVALWGVWMDEHDGQEPGIERFAKVNDVPTATAYRWQALFRRAFPEWATPGPLWSLVRGRIVDPQDAELASLEMAGVQLEPDELGAAS
jgi:hypothetical protein